MPAPRKTRPATADQILLAAHAAYLSGQREDAEAHLRRLLRMEPNNAAAWNNLGSLLGELGRSRDAEAAYRKAILLNPGFADFHVNFALFLKGLARVDEAERSLRDALAQRSQHPPTLAHLAQLLKEAGRLAEAEALFVQAIELDPRFAIAHNNLGILQLDSERTDQAEASFRKALSIDPNFPEAHANLGNALKAARQFSEAEACYRRAIELRPQDRNFLNNLGAILDDLGRPGDSETAYRKTLELAPDFPAGHCNFGRLLQTVGRYGEAEAEYRKAIELDGKFTDAKLNLGLLLLTLGRYEEAWPWHEARHFPDSKARRAMQPPFGFPQWQGEPIAGKSIAVVLEQGHGDNIQFIRYAAMLKDRGAARVTFIQPAPLILFLATAEGLDAITPDAVSLAPHDYWCFPLSLPMHLGTTLDTIPAQLPYLWALPERIERWRPRLPPGFKVGLVWKGNPDHKNDANRSLPHLSALAPLWEVPGVSFISVQKGRGEDEAKNPPPGQPLVELGSDIEDFADSAAIIAQLDLLITVDSAAAHAAGALGKPVWILLPGIGTDWRWLLEREDSPWYPGVMRLFRQPHDAKTWDSTLRTVAQALCQHLALPPPPTLPLFSGSLPELPQVFLAQPIEETPLTPELEALFEKAHDAYRAGNHEESKALLETVLAYDSRNAPAWNNLASIHAEDNNNEEAISAYQKAITLNPSFAEAHANLGNSQRALGRTTDAEASYRQAVALRPGDANTNNNLGILLLENDCAVEAEAAFRAAITAQPGFAEAWNNLGNALKRLKRPFDAEAAYRESIVIQPDNSQFLNNLAVFLGENERAAEAQAILKQITTIAPEYADGWNNLGTSFQNEERFAEAEAAYRKALDLNPSQVQARGNLGNALKAQGRLDEAEAEYLRALEIRPDDTDTMNNLAVLLGGVKRHKESRAYFEKAIDLRPDFAAAWCNLGNTVREMGLNPEAENAYRKAIELDGKFTDAKLNLGLLLLTLGRYEEAWPWHEARHFPDSKARRAMQPPFGFPQWQGEPIAGKSIAVVLEQGHGDNIQFIRYAAMLKDRGAARVTFIQPAPLILFLATAEGLDAITPDAVSLAPHDYWCFPLSLPMHLGTTLDTIPAQLPYLWALPERIERWRPRLPPGFKVGLVWKGNPDHKNDANRSLPHLSALAPLWEVPGVSFISVQKGRGEDEAKNPPPGQPLVELGSDIEDFADSAAIIAQLDLLITVDSAAAHAAGALGKPVWILLPGIGTDWRWLLEREDSPWYPGVMRLFRQPHDAKTWDSTLRTVAQALRQHLALPPPPTLPLFSGSLPELPQVFLETERTNSAADADSEGSESADAAALADRARELEQEREFEEAERLMSQAVRLHPQNEDWLHRHAILLHRTGQVEAAAESYRRLLALDPLSARAHYHYGLLLNETDIDGAEQAYRQAFSLDPDFIEAHWNLALLLLKQGRWHEAWPHFDRRNDRFRGDRDKRYGCPEWRGQSLAGKSILVDSIEGHGDNIMCVRFVERLKKEGASRVTLLHRMSLRPLLETAAGVDSVISDPAEGPRHDYWTFSFSLLIHLDVTPETIPTRIPYLFPRPDRSRHWRSRLETLPGVRVGLVWKGDPATDVDQDRSLPHLAALAPLWQVPSVSFISLQKGQAEDEGRNPPAGQPLLHLGDDIADFADSAAIIDALDVVITVDTAVAHLAGALGKPVWLVLPARSEWRWLLDRDDSPWYPSVMRLFRQFPTDSGWNPVIQRVANALREWTVLRGATKPPVSIPSVGDSVAIDSLLDAAHAAYRDGRREDAASILHTVLGEDPTNATAWNNLAALHVENDEVGMAESAYRKAIELGPNTPEYRFNFASFLKSLSRVAEAEVEYRYALELRPGEANGHNVLGILLLESKRPAEAEAAFRAATHASPQFPEAWNNLGMALQQQDRLQEAEAAFRRALDANSGLVLAHSNLGNLLGLQGRKAEAEAEYRRVLALDPNNIGIHWNLAILLLARGRWHEAWPHFDRRNDPFRQQRQEKFHCPEWRGESIRGKSILIDTIEGNGDNIMCARFAARLKQEGASRVTLFHRAALKPLLETVEGVDKVHSDPDTLPQHDYWCFSFNLVVRFDIRPDSIPAPIPYAFPLESRLAYWRKRLVTIEGLRVGLVWKGDPTKDVDAYRTIPNISMLAPLWDVPGVSFVSLQKGQGEDEAIAHPPNQPILHLGGNIADFGDTAALACLLDLVITVDTAAAHICGALGRPVWVLLPYPGEWRWLEEDRADTPWYPGVMRLFRQSPDAPGDWSFPVRQIAAALASRVAGHPEPAPPTRAVALPPPAETFLRPDEPDPDLESPMTRPALRPAAYVLASSDHGTMIVNRNDYADTGGGRLIGVGCQILFNSSFDRDEIDLALRMLKIRRRMFGDGVVALDCGANIGVHTIEWAKQMHGWGSVIAVEAQERVYYALCGNITINNCFNARAIWGAVGAENGEIMVPKPDYLQPGSYGSLEVRPSANNEFIGQPIDYSKSSGIQTRLFTIDSLALPRVDFVKIDIEGMEMEALAGAMDTLRRFRPQMIIEKIKSNEAELKALLLGEGYRIAPFTGNFVAVHTSDPAHEQLLA